MSVLCCPVCRRALDKKEKSYVCENGHCFDISRQGYVNLLLSNSSSDKRHGDDRRMVAARRDFLEKGYYNILSDCVNELLKERCKSGCVLADAGCGEGWYTQRAANAIEAAQVLGFDISKQAACFAAKRDSSGIYAVASIFSLPVCDGAADALLNIFAPHAYEEFARVLAEDGCLIKVIPLEEHLMELKQAIYDSAYSNEPEALDIPFFTAEKSIELHSEITLDTGEDINNLFMMTPYYYKTGEKEQKKLAQLERLTTRIAFRVTVYRKKTAD